jgi:cation:H+ antiporter
MLALANSPSWTADYPLPAIAAGLGLLVGGASFLVRGAVWIALVLGLSRMAIGLTLVAMGTSMPELMVSLSAARSGHSAIAMANVIGSNTANVLLIVGVAAAIRAIHTEVRGLEVGYLLLATALAGVPFLVGAEVSRWLGAGMMVMLVAFCAQLLQRERRQRTTETGSRPASTASGWLLHLGLFAGGLLALVYGAEWLVDGSVSIAKSFGMSEALVGMTIVAVGTSLPELATSALAARRGESAIAIGNVIGSNIFNVGAVLGGAAVLQPFPVATGELWRLMVATAVSAVWLLAVLVGRFGVGRAMGITMLVAYFGYLALEVVLLPPG